MIRIFFGVGEILGGGGGGEEGLEGGGGGGGWRQHRLHPSPRPPSRWRGESQALVQILETQKSWQALLPSHPPTHLLAAKSIQNLLPLFGASETQKPKKHIQIQVEVIDETCLPEV